MSASPDDPAPGAWRRRREELTQALFARSRFVTRLPGVAVVGNDGRPARRLHALVRSLIAWSPFIVVAPGTFALLVPLGGMPLAGPAAVFLAFGVIAYSASLPGRGLHDRIARTWLVPR